MPELSAFVVTMPGMVARYDERCVTFVELVSFFFIVDVRKFQRARNGTF